MVAPQTDGWWYTYPSEKYEFVSWDDYSQYILENKSHVPNHQPVMADRFSNFHTSTEKKTTPTRNDTKQMAQKTSNQRLWVSSSSTSFIRHHHHHPPPPRHHRR